MSSCSGGSKLPKDWPRDILYLLSPSYSNALTDEAHKFIFLSKLNLPSNTEVRRVSGPHTNVKITPISDTFHPAHGQFGLFAGQHLSPDTLILPYLGYVHGKADTDENSDYDLSLDRDHALGVDASKMGNEARFINDYRSISANPNAEFRDISIDIGKGLVEKRIGVFVLSAGKSGKRAKGIAKGEEILVSYGKGFWTERLKPKE
ncbi:hypothetical protein BDV96DRAFT_612654 [Lophiotrema nucula]|uniref:SET domain-containing protein n=1 Tax=Lophiotrema nucula TaxID=690887 RepID=A0A6A5ZA59_9PLEO|nr:hypothetical protein BDV96DRAFT_612654 [Lophiotrema nucula]